MNGQSMSALASLISQHHIQFVDISDLSPLLPLIDCRTQDDFIEAHLIDSTSIPCGELFERMHELPQRHIHLTLYGDKDSLITAITFLTEKGYTITKVALWPSDDTLSRKRISIESGIRSKPLWSPASIIKRFTQDYLPKLQTQTLEKKPLVGLDIACGSGRDMVYLAQQGIQMMGVDYHQDALARAQRLAHSCQVDIKTIQQDLEASDGLINGFQSPYFEPSQFDLICVLRYLHRPLLPVIDTLLAPGGVIIYQTFMEGCETISSPKNPRFLLKVKELSKAFSHYTIWLDEIEFLRDSRPVSAFIAQKPSKG